jgi:hypothetical protein
MSNTVAAAEADPIFVLIKRYRKEQENLLTAVMWDGQLTKNLDRLCAEGKVAEEIDWYKNQLDEMRAKRSDCERITGATSDEIIEWQPTTVYGCAAKLNILTNNPKDIHIPGVPEAILECAEMICDEMFNGVSAAEASE